MKHIAIIAGCLTFLVAITLLPIPIPSSLDFEALYHVVFGLHRGIPVYDYPAQVQMIADLAHVSINQVELRPFAYPPWYALSVFYLGWLSIETAARLWLGLNLIMLILATWLLTDRWPARSKILAIIAALFFAPSLGSLFIGQFVFPVILGISLFGFGVVRRSAALIGLSVVLMTFKPHLGWLIVLASIFYLVLRRDDLGHRSLIAILIAAVFLSLLGLLADPAWPITYPHALLGFGTSSGISMCDLCFSLPILLSIEITGAPSLVYAAGIGLIILVLLILIGKTKFAFFSSDPSAWTAASVLLTLLVDPYLHNYDFVILLIPLFWLVAQTKKQLGRFLLGICYLLPWLGLILLGRNGNTVLLLSSLILTGMFYFQTQHIDVSPSIA